MEIINKKHDKITSNQRADLAAYLKIESQRNLYLSAGATHLLALSPQLYMHFVNDDDRWFFYTNDESDGFKLTGRPGKNAFLICDLSLVTLFRKRTLCSIGSSFPIRVTEARIKGSHLIEILINKPIER